jgi:hypothetical protein
MPPEEDNLMQHLTLKNLITGITLAVLVGGFFVQYYVNQAMLSAHIQRAKEIGAAQMIVNTRQIELSEAIKKNQDAIRMDLVKMQTAHEVEARFKRK